MPTTPNDDPRYADLLSRAPQNHMLGDDSETFFFTLLTRDRRVKWVSPRMPFGTLKTYRFSPRFSSVWSCELRFSIVNKRRGEESQSTVRMPRVDVPSSSGTSVSLYQPNDSYASAVSNLRRRSARALTVPRSGFSGSSGSSTRPSPERHYTTYNERFWTNTGVDSSTSNTYLTYERLWSGTRTPNFRTLKKRQLPVNAHMSQTVKWNYGYCLVENRDIFGSWNSRIFAWPTFLPVPPGPTHPSDLSNTALRRLIDRAQVGIRANLAQDLVQISQTTRMIDNTVKRLTEAIRAVKKKDLLGAAQVLYDPQARMKNRRKEPRRGESTAKNWLELQYGWKPLLSDIHGSMEALANYNLSNTSIKRVSSSATRKKITRVPILDETVSPARIIGWENSETFSKARYGVTYVLDAHLLSFLAQTGFTNPINLLWEVIPYSFVIDWFLPIGPYLETLNAWQGLTFKEGFLTLFTRQNTSCTLSWSGQLGPFSSGVKHGAMNREWVILNRGRLESFPGARFPQFKNPFSVTHVLNGLALMRTAFRR